MSDSRSTRPKIVEDVGSPLSCLVALDDKKKKKGDSFTGTFSRPTERLDNSVTF